jgi:hypothetical protein
VDSVDLHSVYAITPLYNQNNWSLNNNEYISGMTVSTSVNNNNISSSPQLRGFQLHTYEKMDDNILREILIIFQSNLSNQIDQWFDLLSKIISECKKIFFSLLFIEQILSDKPARNIIVLCNPYAGLRQNRHIFNTKIKPLLDKAQYITTYLGKK